MGYQLNFFTCLECGDFHDNDCSEYCLPCEVLKVLNNSPGSDKKQCFICFKKFSAVSSRDRHLKTHNPIKIKPFKCDRKGCKLAFETKSRLKRHDLIHSKVKFPCWNCNSILSTRDNLNYHLKFNCPNHAKKMGYNCIVKSCGYECGNYENWQDHVKGYHGLNKHYYSQKINNGSSL